MSPVLLVTCMLAVQVVLIGAIAWKLPDWSRPELLLGVTVPAEVRRGSAGQAIIAGLRRRVVWAGAVALAALGLVAVLHFSAGVGEGLGAAVAIAVIVLHGAAIAIAFVQARRRALTLAVAPSGRREATLDVTPQPLPGGLLWQSGPFVLFGLLALFLTWMWSDIPARYVTHWDHQFRPDGWSDKSLIVVFGLPALGLLLAGMFPPIAWSLLNRSRRVHVRGEAGRIETARRHAVAVLLLWVEYLLVLLFAPMGLLPFAQSAGSAQGLLVAVLVLSIGAPLVMIVTWFVRYGSVLTTRARDAEAAPQGAPIGDRTEDRFWKWGLIYYNRDDPALWVEKRIGVGYTFNMARPAAWWILAAAIGVPVAATVALALAS